MRGNIDKENLKNSPSSVVFCRFHKWNNSLCDYLLPVWPVVLFLDSKRCEFQHVLQHEAFLASAAAWECDTQNSPAGVRYMRGLDGGFTCLSPPLLSDPQAPRGRSLDTSAKHATSVDLRVTTGSMLSAFYLNYYLCHRLKLNCLKSTKNCLFSSTWTVFISET